MSVNSLEGFTANIAKAESDLKESWEKEQNRLQQEKKDLMNQQEVELGRRHSRGPSSELSSPVKTKTDVTIEELSKKNFLSFERIATGRISLSSSPMASPRTQGTTYWNTGGQNQN